MSAKLLSILVSLVASVATTVAQPIAATFNHPQRFPAGDRPSVAAIADFNRDGKPDIATAANDGVAILLNNGNGFAPPVVYAAGGASKSMAVADFNRDGNSDVAVVGGTNSIYILLGNGDGTFQPAVQIPIPSPALSIVAGDFNGDGIADLAVAAGSVLVLPGNGHGGFGPPIATSTKPPAAVLAAGDFNNDGKLDLAVDVQYSAGHDNYRLVTLLGNGDGTFQPAITVLSRYSSGALLVTDINDDGIVDIVMPGQYLLGNGDGTFTTGGEYPTDGSPVFPAVADVNGDGHTDLLAVNKCGTVSISLGSANGVFQPAYSYIASDALRWIATANFLGHGYQDIAMIAGSTIELLPGGRDGKYQAQPLINIQQSAVNNPVLADFNGDGNLDAAVLSYESGVSILLGNGKGGFTAAAPAMTGPYPSAMVSGDFNGDGKTDLAIADGQNKSIHILIGKGDGSFSNGSIFAAPADCGQFVASCYVLATADLNGDGKLDLIVLGGDVDGTGTAKAEAFLGNGDGTFGGLLPIASGLEVRQFAIGDFNGDGHPDVVLSNEANGPVLYLGNGDGTFQAPMPLYTEGPSQIAAGDFNGDGYLDLAFTNAQSQLVVLLGSGNATFRQSQTISQFNGVPIVGDLNGDGHPDLFALDLETKVFWIYLGNGDGTFTQQMGPPISCVSINWCGAALGDLNGDGKLDIFSVQIGNDYATTPVTALINTTHP
ncbi:MAG: FG-GAP repeat domain-containing protein [Bryobacteraceae bacterium]